MRVTVPVYVEEHGRRRRQMFHARPLFFPSPHVEGHLLTRVLSKLAMALQRHLRSTSAQAGHDQLLPWTFSPPISEHRLRLHLLLRKKTVRLHTLFVAFKSLDRRIVCAPSLPDVWFDVRKGQNLRDRATEVLLAYYRELEKDGGLAEVDRRVSKARNPWVTSLDLEFEPPLPRIVREQETLAGLMSGEQLDGADELDRVGVCLDFLYPDELERVVFRDREVDELDRLLAAPDKRPVMLVGPRQAGKTAIIHEHVFRRVERRRQTYARRKKVWLLSPQRLISGMMCVGQWEDRLLAILRLAQRVDHVLYFDDLVGLCLAGVSAGSDLSVAHVLRSFVERRTIRVLAEITPEALRVLRERDRGMADLFHVVPVGETAAPETRRILIRHARRLEAQHGCRFALDVIPTATELLARYVPEVAFPGKAAGFLGQLAAKYGNAVIDRDTVLQEFQSKSGLSIGFLDVTSKLERKDVVSALEKQIIGQAEPVRAMADAVCVSKARLNELGKPMGSFLFLGPTGVGKTQCAKALATYLFGSPKRLVRFDMNEYVTAASVGRLVGTFADPEGLLTSAIRRQPFSVVLLDEIEKAHPSAFDLLLQVLGEARLTDALGRTADFSNTIIILTSNLGVREADSDFGFAPTLEGDRRRQERFVRAAEAFFRPEFFNRLDRVISFDPLGRADLRSIAEQLIGDVFRRDGLLQRQSLLQIEPSAMERIIDRGYHPKLGARALKRAIEQHLTRPVAERLASVTRDRPAVIRVFAGGSDIRAHTQPLLQAEARRVALPPSLDEHPEVVLEAVRAEIVRTGESLDRGRSDEPIEPGELTEADHRAFIVREHLRRISSMTERLALMLAASGLRSATAPLATPQRGQSLRRWNAKHDPAGQVLRSDQDLREMLEEIAEVAEPYGHSTNDRMCQLLGELALVHMMTTRSEASDRAVMIMRTLTDHEPENDRDEDSFLSPWSLLRKGLLDLVAKNFGFSIKPLGEPPGGVYSVLLAEGPGVSSLAAVEAGTHLFVSVVGHLGLMQVTTLEIDDAAEAASVVNAHLESIKRWRSDLADGRATIDDDPWPLAPVIRLYDDRRTLDLRSGLLAIGWPKTEELRSFILSQLPLPSSVMV